MSDMGIMARIGLAAKSPLAAIVWREVLDALRDRRTLITAAILPMLLVPLSINLPMFFMSPQRNPPNIGVLQLDAEASGFIALIKSVEELRVTDLSQGQNLTKLVETNTYDVVVVIPDNFTKLIREEKKAAIQIIYDGSNQRSSSGVILIKALEGAYAQAIVEERLRERQIDPALLSPIEVNTIDIKGVSQAQAMVGMLIPYFIGLLSILAGASFVNDTTAGEKERKTLEAFLTMPVTRLQILLGKYFGVMILSLMGVFFQFIGMYVGMSIYLTLFQELIGEAAQPLVISPASFAIIALFSLILSMTGNAILMTVCTFAKSFKEGQQYTSSLVTAFAVPLIIIMYLPPSLLSKMLLLPLLGPLVAMRDAIFNIYTPTQIVLALLSSIVYLSALLFAAHKTFSSDKILFRA